MTFYVQHVRLRNVKKIIQEEKIMKSRYRIKEFREAMNLSQEELAIKANVSRTTISNLETGKATEASTVTLRRIAEALEKKPNEIFLS